MSGRSNDRVLHPRAEARAASDLRIKTVCKEERVRDEFVDKPRIDVIESDEHVAVKGNLQHGLHLARTARRPIQAVGGAVSSLYHDVKVDIKPSDELCAATTASAREECAKTT